MKRGEDGPSEASGPFLRAVFSCRYGPHFIADLIPGGIPDASMQACSVEYGALKELKNEEKAEDLNEDYCVCIIRLSVCWRLLCS